MMSFKPQWNIVELEETTSTSDIVRGHPVWTAVRAGRQTAGRGRYGRAWSSDPGGLWLSAAMPVPLECDAEAMAVFALCMAEAVAGWLHEAGVQAARVRWPNDVLIGERKLAGLLCELLWPSRFIVGLGMNIANAQILNAELETPAAILGEWLPDVSPHRAMGTVLHLLTTVHHGFGVGGREQALARLNSAWRAGREVMIEWADGRTPSRGRFIGVDPRGWPQIDFAGTAGTTGLSPASIRRLREI